MNNKYVLVRENGEQWINCPNNGGECCETKFETVGELNRLMARIKRLEEALRRIANQDYRGNRSTESQIAFDALKEDKP